MVQQFQDAMAIVRTCGKPDFFITFTCNPNWEEIRLNPLEGQRSQDRQDLISRVFNLKLKEFIQDLKMECLVSIKQLFIQLNFKSEVYRMLISF